MFFLSLLCFNKFVFFTLLCFNKFVLLKLLFFFLFFVLCLKLSDYEVCCENLLSGVLFSR